MGGAQGDDLPLEDPLKGVMKSNRSSSSCCCCQVDQVIRPQRLTTVATSRLVSLRVLLGIRMTMLLLLVLGAVWLSWRSSSDNSNDEELPRFLCWPDWSYVVCTLYLLMACIACIRQSRVRPFTPRSSVLGSADSARRSVVNTITHILLEVAVVFQTIAVPVTWVNDVRRGRSEKRAVVHLVALGAVVTDLFLNRARVETKHLWIMLGFLLTWVVEQAAWVHSGSSHDACYSNVFDLKGLRSLSTAVIAAIIVVAVGGVYVVLCVQRDRLTSQFERSDIDFTGPDVDEDAGQETSDTASMPLPVIIRPPPAACKRSAVVNPIFAGSGSRMKRPWPKSTGVGGSDNRISMVSNETEMSPAEDFEVRWSGDAEQPWAGSSTKGPSPLLAPEVSRHCALNGVGGRRPDSRTAATSEEMVAHHSIRAAYTGAAAWVRPSNRDATPTAQGHRGGPKRAPSRTLSTPSNSRWMG